jgi:tRNA A37 methylthiotransferase MiaB
MSAPVTVALATLGCRLNQVESREIGALLGHGFRWWATAAAVRDQHLP